MTTENKKSFGDKLFYLLIELIGIPLRLFFSGPALIIMIFDLLSKHYNKEEPLLCNQQSNQASGTNPPRTVLNSTTAPTAGPLVH